MKDKKVIDATTMTCIEMFDESQTEKMVEKYQSLGRWDDVSVDCNGDLILSDE